jgi:hypothetical protein
MGVGTNHMILVLNKGSRCQWVEALPGKLSVHPGLPTQLEKEILFLNLLGY